MCFVCVLPSSSSTALLSFSRSLPCFFFATKKNPPYPCKPMHTQLHPAAALLPFSLIQFSPPFPRFSSSYHADADLEGEGVGGVWGGFYPTTYYSVICFFFLQFFLLVFFVVFVSSFACIKIKGNKVREQRKKKNSGMKIRVLPLLPIKRTLTHAHKSPAK